MRIIAGTARGTQLFAPRGMDTRPTTDKVKESLFNMLQGEVEEASVLDLFSGSGGLGLECLSRGAECAVLVDQSREAIGCIRRNVDKLRFGDRSTVLAMDWQKAAGQLAAQGRQFDLVFLDPPYRMDDLRDMCDLLAAKGLLAEEALVVWERKSGSDKQLSARFSLIKQREYGETEICFYRYSLEEKA
ncbi:MAG: 16S rRNA (guanine(966)-N(2))-methyltransferase RsmD [Clostridiales bacterium]|nr:16S rRNA (guanine(966)-N(2))-methyltransferase RsmD [Clostridiales bacterium]